MITDAFDNSEVLFGTKDFYGEQKHLCDKCMIVFSEQIFEYMLDTYEHQEVGAIRCCNGITPVYVFDIEGMKIAGYLSHIGSALAGALSMAFHCTLMAPHGGIFVFPVVGNALMYLVALAAGTVVSALLLGVLKKKVA